MAVHIVIPARLASTRLRRKPLVEIAGVPMIVRVAEQAARVRADDVTVAVDDAEVFAVVHAAGFSAVMTRADHPSGSDRVYEVVEQLDWADDDLVVNVQGDEPLLPPGVVDSLVNAMLVRPDILLGTVSEPLARSDALLDPNAVKVVTDADDHALYFSRAPIPYPRDEMHAAAGQAALQSLLDQGALRRHVGIYAFRVVGLKQFVALGVSHLEAIEKLEQLRWLEAGYPMLVLRHTTAIPGGVDTAEDLARVAQLFDGAEEA